MKLFRPIQHKYGMLLSDLNEAARLPLRKNVLDRMRGSYGALVVTMDPKDFLLLTASPSDLETILARPFPEPQETFYRPECYGKFEMPYLNVQHPSGKVIGHEGRHRAAMVMRAGGTSYPCVVFLRAQDSYYITYRKEIDGDSTQEREDGFPNYDAAEGRAEELRNSSTDDVWISRVKVNTGFGDTYKGSPTYAANNPDSDYWERTHKAYIKADMPRQLVSQYSDDVVVTKFRVGLVKGYKHFR